MHSITPDAPCRKPISAQRHLGHAPTPESIATRVSPGGRRSGRGRLIGTLVEFIGLPGSGKSTLQRELLRDTALSMTGPFYSRSSAPQGLRRRLAGGARLVLTIVSQWRLSRLVLSRLRVEGPRRSLEGLRRTIGVVVEARRGLATDLSSITVLDEGPLQRALRVFVVRGGGSAPATADLERYLAMTPRSRVVVHVRAPATTCIERVRGRAGALPGRWASLTDAELLDVFTTMDGILDQLVTLLRREGSDTIVVEDDAAGGNLRSRTSLVIEAIRLAHATTSERSAAPLL